MRFFTPETISDAVRLLGKSKNYHCLAGGGLVVAGMRDGVRPAALISLKHVADLRGIAAAFSGGIRIGAMTSHTDVVGSTMFAGGLALVRRAAAEIAHPVIRNMATIGGTLSRADPCADYSCALLAADAVVHLQSAAGERTVPIAEFTIADGKTVRRHDEVIAAISLRGDAEQGSGGYARFSRVDGDYPVATAAVRLGWRAGSVVSARVAIGGCGPTAYLVDGAAAMLSGATVPADVPDALMSAAVDAAQPKSDIKGSAEYRRMLIPGLLRRALLQAFAGNAS